MPARPTSPKGRPIAVGYLRRSTDRQERSIPDQKKAIEAYACEQGMRIVHFYVDDAISGTSVAKRPGFREMIEDAESGKQNFRFVIVYDVKRFGRLDNDEAGYYRHLLRRAKVEVCYTSENFSGDSTDDLIRPVKQWQARQESKDLSKVTIRGQLSRVEGGWWMGGTPPYGYDLEYVDERGQALFQLRFLPDGKKEMRDPKGALLRTLSKGESISVSKRDMARLVPSSQERVGVVKRVFQMSAEEGRGLRAIADALNREGLPSPRGPEWSRIYSGKWSLSTIRSLLLNPHYKGDLVWNRRTDARFFSIKSGRAVERPTAYGVRLEPNAQEDWIVIRNTHAPLVDRELWELALARREGRATSKAQRGRVVGGWTGSRARFLLSGLVRCGRCGAKYVGCHRVKGTPKRDGSRVKTYYYGCSAYIRHGKSQCSFGPIPQGEFEAEVIRQALEAYAPYLAAGGKERLAEETQKALGSSWEEGEAALKRAEEEVKRIDKSIANLLDSLSPINRDHVDSRLQEMDREKATILRRIEELSFLRNEKGDLDSRVAETWLFLATLETTLQDGNPDQRRRAIRRTVADVEVGATKPIHLSVEVRPHLQ